MIAEPPLRFQVPVALSPTQLSLSVLVSVPPVWLSVPTPPAPRIKWLPPFPVFVNDPPDRLKVPLPPPRPMATQLLIVTEPVPDKSYCPTDPPPWPTHNSFAEVNVPPDWFT